MLKVFLDTDIGSDIDDALALLLVLHLPDVELLGITTVYGKAVLRARIAQRILDSAGCDVPVMAGCGRPRRPAFPIWHTGTEGVGILNEEAEPDAPDVEEESPERAVNWMADCALSRPGEVTLIAIGALTNIAMALEARPEFDQSVREMVFMGAGINYPGKLPRSFPPGTVLRARPSHNVGCDVAAAQRVFSSRMPIRVLTNDVTTLVWWDGEGVQQLMKADEPAEVAAVGRLMRVWLEHRTRVRLRRVTGTCPHDPLTVAEAIYPGRFVDYLRGWIEIHDDGASSFRPDENGPHQVGYRVDAKGFLDWLTHQLLHGRVPVAKAHVRVKQPGVGTGRHMSPCQEMQEAANPAEQPYRWPDLSDRRVFILGLGGGSDVITAYAVAEMFRRQTGAEAVYGNTKRHAQGLIALTDHVHVLPADTSEPSRRQLARAHGSTAIDQLLPRGPRDCPFIVVLPRQDSNVHEQIVAEIQSLGFDFLVGVDTGGDSLTDQATSGPEGRDRQMLRLMQQTGLPLLLVVAAPGSDGETEHEVLQQTFQAQQEAGRYLGAFSLAPVFRLLQELAVDLPAYRTPNIILDAAGGRLASHDGERLRVPRGREPLIPASWLQSAFVFEVPPPE